MCAFLAEKAPTAPSEGYLMSRDLPTRPAPDRFKAGEEIWILLQGRHD